MLRKAYIFDIDGTIVDSEPRFKRATRPDGKIDWSKAYEGIEDDVVFSWAKDVIHSLTVRSSAALLFLTGRPEKLRTATIRSLQTQLGELLILGSNLLMRPDGCFKQDSIVKREIFMKEIRPYYEVLAVFEDRTRNVEMFRDLGLICLQCAKGDF